MNNAPLPGLQNLLDEYYNAVSDLYPRWPWTHSAMTPELAPVLENLVEQWISGYNSVWAQTESEVIPITCWQQHKALAIQATVMTWAYYYAHHDPRATPLIAAQFHYQTLKDFRGGVQGWLGEEPRKCRAGQHPDSWRAGPQSLIDLLEGNATNNVYSEHEGFPLRELHFGFNHLRPDPDTGGS